MLEFREAILAQGLTPPDIIEPGRFHRFPGAGKNRGNTSGWCKLFPEGTGGVFGDHSKPEIKGTWQAKTDRPYSIEDQAAFRRQIEETRKQAQETLKAEQAKAAKEAAAILARAKGDPTSHPYTLLKGIPLGDKVRRGAWPQRAWSDALLVPLYDQAGKITTLQAINVDGEKDFLKGGQKKGCFFPLGKFSGITGRVLVGEGLATVAAAVHSTGLPGVVAIDAGNLCPVAKVVRQLAPKAQIVIIADDDQKADDSNPGREAALKAAKSVGGKVALPDLGKKGDAWDVWKEQGPEAVKKMIEQAARPEQTSNETGASSGWPELLPLTVHHQASPYPLDALPGTIGAAVREVVDFVKCPVALGACSALSVVSTVAQALVDVRRADKLEGPTSLFLLAVADSGERKTTVDGFFSKPVQQWEAEQAEAAKPGLNRYDAEKETWEAKKSGLLAAIKDATKGGKGTGDLERRMADLEAEKPVPPKVPRLLFGDSTPEALAHRLAHGWPVGGVLSSEAGTVFGGHAMGNDSAMRNMAMLNSLWGAEPLTVDRKKEGGSFTLRGARLTMGLAVQSETVRAFLDSSRGLARGIGWLARFLIAWPESTQGGRMFKEPPETWPNLAKFHRQLGALLDHPLKLNDRGELEPATLEFSPEAKAEWVAFHDEVETELRPGRDMAETKDVASKAADNAARLAALFHLFENGLGGTIGLDYMTAAATLASWHLYEARRFMGEIALPVELNNAAKLEAWLLGYCQKELVAEVSTRDAQRLGPNCTREKRTLDAALEELAEAGRVRFVEGGRRKLVRINPLLLEGHHGAA